MPDHSSQALHKVRARDAGMDLEAEVALTEKEEGARLPQPERGTQQGIVAEARMSIQGQVRAIHGEVVIQEETEKLVAPASPWVAWAPE